MMDKGEVTSKVKSKVKSKDKSKDKGKDEDKDRGNSNANLNPLVYEWLVQNGYTSCAHMFLKESCTGVSSKASQDSSGSGIDRDKSPRSSAEVRGGHKDETEQLVRKRPLESTQASASASCYAFEVDEDDHCESPEDA